MKTSNIVAGTSGTLVLKLFLSIRPKDSGGGTPEVPGQLELKLPQTRACIIHNLRELMKTGNLDPPSKLIKYDVTIHSQHKLTATNLDIARSI